MRVIEALEHLIPAGGLIGAMSSGQGSITNNQTWMREVYRGSKVALNMFMRSFATRQSDAPRAMVLMAPGSRHACFRDETCTTSCNEIYNAAIDAQCRARRGGRLLRANVHDHVCDLVDRSQTSDQ
jgi:NAD(P)-dependent dehydrogenase (short-subunit alcohol dehydrogenase family)